VPVSKTGGCGFDSCLACLTKITPSSGHFGRGGVLAVKKEYCVAEKVEEKVKKPNAIQRYYRETIGELRKVAWPTPQEAWRLTVIVILTMIGTSMALGILDWVFATVIALLVA
jgi:preprotein translocase subunit SecE